MQEIFINSQKVLLFSDIHWGKSKDSDIKLEITNEFIDWIIFFCKERNIKDIFFLGDWFDNRTSISVKTFNSSYEALKKISSNGLRIYKLVGNHDCYFKDSCELNSIKPFSDIPGVTTINELTKVHFSKSNKYGLFAPWGKFNNNTTEKFDIVFAHLSFIGAQLNSSSIEQVGYNPETLFNICPKIITGHLHINKEYSFKNGLIKSIGCPFELDWGDYENEKGIYVLDTNTLDLSFIKNTLNPIHVKLFWSRIKAKIEDISKIRGNFVKFIVDEEYKYDQIIKVIAFINAKKPIKNCDVEYVFNTKFSNDLINEDEESTNAVHMTKQQYMNKFLEKHIDQTNGLDLVKLKTMANNYFTGNNNE
jgi:DNA repair exonuclease SbcCD nuclease subunit